MPLLRGLSVLFLMKQNLPDLTGDARESVFHARGPRNNKQPHAPSIPAMWILFLSEGEQRELTLKGLPRLSLVTE